MTRKVFPSVLAVLCVVAITSLGRSAIAARKQFNAEVTGAAIELRFVEVSDTHDPFSPANQDGVFDVNTLHFALAVGPLAGSPSRSFDRFGRFHLPMARRAGRIVVRLDYAIFGTGTTVIRLKKDFDYIPSQIIENAPRASGSRFQPAAIPGEIDWDGRDASGSLVPDGTYDYTVNADLLQVVGQHETAVAHAAPATGQITVDNTPPSVVSVSSSVLSDSDNSYPTGRVVRIDVTEAPDTVDVDAGAIRITSASSGYDSGVRPIPSASLFFLWDTAGLPFANDYVATVYFTDRAGQTTNAALTMALSPNPPTINKLISTVDMSVDAIGPSVHVVRSYLLDSTFDGPLGYGWTHNYRMRALELPAFGRFLNGTLLPLRRTVHIFNADGTGSYFFPNEDGTYRSPRGDFRTLRRLANAVYELTTKFGLRHYFSPNGKLFQVTERNGLSAKLHYDATDRLEAIEDSSGQFTILEYNPDGRIGRIIDPANRVVTYAYDVTGNLTSVKDPGGAETHYAYDAQHNLTSVTDPRNNSWFYSTDADDRLRSITDSSGHVLLSLDFATPSPTQLTVTNALGHSTVVTFDEYSSVTRLVDALGHFTRFTYDADRNVTNTIDANGRLSHFVYDARGNMVRSINAIGTILALTYDPVFNLVTSLTDGNGHTTTFTYDATGQLVRTTFPDGSFDALSYDGHGNVATTTNRRGHVTRYTYDLAGRLTTKSYSDGTSDTFEYDTRGNLVAVSDTIGTHEFAYDTSDRRTHETFPDGAGIGYEYDSAGNRTRLVYPDGESLESQYDSENRLIVLRQGSSTLASYDYDSLGRLERRTLQNGLVTTYGYDAMSRLSTLNNRDASGNALSTFTYGFDGIGNRLSATTGDGTAHYSYDGSGQLVDVTYPNLDVISYDLDAAGNRRAVSAGGDTTQYTSNVLNQYTTVGATSLTYDLDGNLTSETSSGGTIAYTYDSENRLMHVETPTASVDYAYDAFGRRVLTRDANGVTKYVYDGQNVLHEQDGGGVLQREYVYGPGTDEVLIRRDLATPHFFSHDAIGSVVGITDSLGHLVESYSYDAFGALKSGPTTNTLLFAGSRYDADSDLYFMRSRYYSPRLGRFISVDPLLFAPGPNLYEYVHNDPVNRTDPFGLSGARCCRPLEDVTAPLRDPNLLRKRFRERVVPLLKRFIPTFARDNVGLLWRGSKYERFFDIADKTVDFWDSDNWQDAVSSVIPYWDTFELLADEMNKVYRENSVDDAVGGDGDSSSDDPEDCGAFPWACACHVAPPMCLDPCVTAPHTCACSDGICAPDPTFIQLAGASSIEERIELMTRQEEQWITREDLVAKLLVPFDDSLVRGDIPISGLAFGKGFSSYRVEFGLGASPTQWTTIAESTSEQRTPLEPDALDDSSDTTIRGNLATWDTGLRTYVYLPSHPKNHPIDLKGPHTLRLVVTSADGETVEDRISVTVADVIPNAWGGQVISSDGHAVLSIPEQGLPSAFRLISIEPTLDVPDEVFPGRTMLGVSYVAREPGEVFMKPAVLRIEVPETIRRNPDLLGVYGYNPATHHWEHISSHRSDGDTTVQAEVLKLFPYYALMASTLRGEGSSAEPQSGFPIEGGSSVERSHLDDVLINDTFENGVGQWSSRDGEFGASISLETVSNGTTGYALRIRNPRVGGNFAVNAVTTPFDAREFPQVEFDYRAPPNVKTNFLVKVAGRWYEIGFTDDAKELRDLRVNIAHIGDIRGINSDDRWHRARFNLYDMLRTKTRSTIVEALVMADWDVVGYMKLVFGRGRKGATYFIDNFSIRRDDRPRPNNPQLTLFLDDFEGSSELREIGARASTFTDGKTGRVEARIVDTSPAGKGHSLSLTYDVSRPGAYAGYLMQFPSLDLRDFAALSFLLDLESKAVGLLVGVRDRFGHESKVRISGFLATHAGSAWSMATIPFVAFADDVDWSEIENVSLSFEHGLCERGAVFVDQLEFKRGMQSVLVDDFERGDGKNALGRQHSTFFSGAAAIQGSRIVESTNRFYRLSYGGSIGVSEGEKSYAGWETQLGGIDCSECQLLTLRVRGAHGGTVYLDDGNFRWGVELGRHAPIDDTWKNVNISLREFADYGVDLTHLDKLQVVFEGAPMSGSVSLDDIRFALDRSGAAAE